MPSSENYCGQCGSQLAEHARFCGSCGSRLEVVDTRTADDLQHGTAPLQKLGSRRMPLKLLLSVGAGLLALSVAASVVVVSIAHSVPSSNKGLPNASSAPTPSSKELPSNVPKPLSFASGGKLPTSYQGLSLGMTQAEALAARPQLELPEEWNKDPTAQGAFLEDSPSSHSVDPSVSVTVFQGRVVTIEASKSRISPDDAKAFEDHTLGLLGKPDGSDSVPAQSRQTYVWIDGDVRIKFECYGEADSFSPRRVGMVMTVYPLYLQYSGFYQFGPKAFNSIERERDWADTSPDPIVAKEVPREIAGLRLGTSPAEVRAVFGFANMRTTYNEHIEGTLTREDGTLIDLEFWRGRLVNVWVHSPPSEKRVWTEQLNTLEGRYGTPSAWLGYAGPKGPVVTATWADNQTALSFSLMPGEQNGGARVLWGLRDWRVLQEKKEGEHRQFLLEHPGNPQTYAQTNALKSFF